MKKHFIILCVVILPLFSLPLKILEIVGDKTISKKDLYLKLGLTSEQKLFSFEQDNNVTIKQNEINSLKNTLINLYKSEGFYSVKVDVKEDKKRVVFHIFEGKPIIVKKIVIDSDLDDIKKFIHLKVSQRFIASMFAKSRSDINNYLKQKGYCNADFKTKAYLDTKTYQAKLIYKLKKNQRCKFGDIDIQTDKKIFDDIILSRVPFEKGEPYSSNKIEKTYQNLIALDTFDVINIQDSNFGDRINVKIKTKRSKPSSSVRVGVGYETKYGANALFHWQRRNFLDEAKKLSFDMKYSKDEKYIKNTYFIPSIMHSDILKRYLDLKNEFSYLNTVYSDFEEKKISQILHLQDTVSLISLDVGLDLEKIDITKDVSNCYINAGNFFLTSLFAEVTLDKRDSKIDPKNGYLLSAYLESGFGDVSSFYPFYKLKIEGRAIKTLNGFTIALKSKIGFLNEYKNRLPASKYFFAGGSFSNRAYGYNRLGATDAVCNGVGGRTLWDSSLEVEHRIYKKLYGALFLDSTVLNTKVFDLSTKRVNSYGFGLRYKTLIGPVKFDVGVRSDDSSIYAFHFQIGQSF